MKIFRVEVWGTKDSCEESWDWIPLSEYYLDEDLALKKLDEMTKLDKTELEELINAETYNNTPEINVSDLNVEGFVIIKN